MNVKPMKKRVITGLIIAAFSMLAHAQTDTKKLSVALVDFDCSGYSINTLQVKQYVINELIRIQKYEVMDKHEIDYIAAKDSLTPEGCFSKECLQKFGRKLGVDYMFTGDIIRIGENINISLRLLNVQTGTFEKMNIKEFLFIQGNELMMIRITLNELFGLPNDAEIVKKLTVKADFDNNINNPYRMRLRTDGPRMGFAFFTGTTATVMQANKSKGGFESAYPATFQFGYQFEKQYLNEGNFQALFEFIPSVSGIDQGRVVPSFTFLNGLRNNKNGWEFGIGPTFSINKMAEGFYDNNNQWRLKSDLSLFPSNTFNLTTRPDSRGDATLVAGLVIGVGKTFKSGRMNIPVNAFVVPGNHGTRFGVSFGWNGKDRFEAVK